MLGFRKEVVTRLEANRIEKRKREAAGT
jgi:hypothetical protein